MSWFPRKELSIGGKTYAIFVTESGHFDIIKMSARKGRSFAGKYGYFEPNDKYRYICGNSDIYFFDQNSSTPLNIKALIDIQSYLAKIPGKASLLPDEVKDIALDKNKQIAEGIGAHAIRFLDDYYLEDDVVRHDIMMEAQHKDRFKLKVSHSIIPFIPQSTIAKKNLAIVVINDTTLDIIAVEVKTDADKQVRYFEDPKYGKFIIREPKTRYRYGKTNIYVVAVNTSASPIKPTDVQEVPSTTVAGDKPVQPQTQEQVPIPAVAKKKSKKQLLADKKAAEIAEKNLSPPGEKGDGNGKTKLSKKDEQDKASAKRWLFKKKNDEVPEYFEPVKLPVKVKSGQFDMEPQTVTINANIYLPHAKHNDPVLLQNMFTQVKQAKVGIDLVSKPAVRHFIDPKVIMAIGIVILLIMIIGIPVLSQYSDKLKLPEIKGPLGGIFGGGTPPAQAPPPQQPQGSEDVTGNLKPPAETQQNSGGLPIPQLPTVKLPEFHPP